MEVDEPVRQVDRVPEHLPKPALSSLDELRRGVRFAQNAEMRSAPSSRGDKPSATTAEISQARRDHGEYLPSM